MSSPKKQKLNVCSIQEHNSNGSCFFNYALIVIKSERTCPCCMEQCLTTEITDAGDVLCSECYKDHVKINGDKRKPVHKDLLDCEKHAALYWAIIYKLRSARQTIQFLIQNLNEYIESGFEDEEFGKILAVHASNFFNEAQKKDDFYDKIKEHFYNHLDDYIGIENFDFQHLKKINATWPIFVHNGKFKFIYRMCQPKIPEKFPARVLIFTHCSLSMPHVTISTDNLMYLMDWKNDFCVYKLPDIETKITINPKLWPFTSANTNIYSTSTGVILIKHKYILHVLSYDWREKEWHCENTYNDLSDFHLVQHFEFGIALVFYNLKNNLILKVDDFGHCTLHDLQNVKCTYLIRISNQFYYLVNGKITLKNDGLPDIPHVNGISIRIDVHYVLCPDGVSLLFYGPRDNRIELIRKNETQKILKSWDFDMVIKNLTFTFDKRLLVCLSYQKIFIYELLYFPQLV